MTTVFVEGKEINVPDDDHLRRPPPSRQYENIRADFFDVEKMVEESKRKWKEQNIKLLISNGIDKEEAKVLIPEISKELEDILRERIVNLINETIELEMEKVDLYRNYNKSECKKIINKYSEIIEEINKKYQDTKEKLERISDQKEIDILNSKLIEYDIDKERYQILLDDYILMEKSAK